MGAVKNAFHDEIIWNGLDENERQDALYYASVDTRPKGGDALAETRGGNDAEQR